jgi:hypothetical protein
MTSDKLLQKTLQLLSESSAFPFHGHSLPLPAIIISWASVFLKDPKVDFANEMISCDNGAFRLQENVLANGRGDSPNIVRIRDETQLLFCQSCYIA